MVVCSAISNVVIVFGKVLFKGFYEIAVKYGMFFESADTVFSASYPMPTNITIIAYTRGSHD